MTSEEKKKIIDALVAKKAVNKCSRCEHRDFSVINGYFNQSIQSEITGISLGGPSIPSVVVVCNNCGFMIQHALGPLNLFPEKVNINDKEEKKNRNDENEKS